MTKTYRLSGYNNFLYDEYLCLLEFGDSMGVSKDSTLKHTEEFIKLIVKNNYGLENNLFYYLKLIRVLCFKFDISEEISLKKKTYDSIIESLASKKTKVGFKTKHNDLNSFVSYIKHFLDFFRKIMDLNEILFNQEEYYMSFINLMEFYNQHIAHILNTNNDLIIIELFEIFNDGLEHFDQDYKLKLIKNYVDYYEKYDFKQLVKWSQSKQKATLKVYTFYINIIMFLDEYYVLISDKTTTNKTSNVLEIKKLEKLKEKFRDYMTYLFNSPEWGFKEIQITNVTLTDEKLKKTTLFKTNSQLNVTLSYLSSGKINNPLFIIKISTKTNLNLITLTTKDFNLPNITGKGKLTLNIDKLPLNAGEYDISILVFNLSTTYPYFIGEQMATLSVTNNYTENSGIIRVNHTWDIKIS